MSGVALPTGTRGWNRLPGYRRRRDILFGFRAAGLELVDLATGQPISFSRASPGGLVPVLGGSGASRGTVLCGPHAHDVPRFAMLDRDGDGVRETPTTLLEGSRTNGWTWSEDLSQSVWSKDGLSVMTDAATAPDGQVTMDKVVEDATTGVHQIRRALSGASDNAKQAFSFWVAAAERTWVRISTNGKDSASAVNSYFNLATGEFGTVASRHSLRVIERVGSAYRLECVFDVSSGAATPQFRVGPTTGDATNTYTGDGSSGLYLWGLQFEADQPFASSYIKTTNTPVTRAHDAVTSPWPYGPDTPVSVYARWCLMHGLMAVPGVFPRLWSIGGNSDTAAAVGVHFSSTGGLVLKVNNGAANTSKGLVVSAARDQEVELLTNLYVDADGKLACALTCSVDRGPATSTSGALVAAPAAWTAPALYINGDTLAGHTGFIYLLDFFVLYGAGWTMDAVRNRFGIAV